MVTPLLVRFGIYPVSSLDTDYRLLKFLDDVDDASLLGNPISRPHPV